MTKYKLVYIDSGSESEVFATEIEAEAARAEQINEHLANDIEYLFIKLDPEYDISPSDNDYKYIKELEKNPGAAEDIARRRALEMLVIVDIEDDEA